jgi:RNA polymerase sigma-70 factor (ECF subfamily)
MPLRLRYHSSELALPARAKVSDPDAFRVRDEDRNAESECPFGVQCQAAGQTKAFQMTLAGDRTDIPSPEELASLVARVAAAGDKQAFAVLFRFYAPRLKSFLGRQGFGEIECEDLVQETMLSIWRRAASFDPVKAGVSTWIYTIARNLGIDRWRREGRASTWCELVAADDVDPDPSVEARMIASQSESRVRDALTKLPDEQAAVIRMTFYGEDAQAEIARMLGIPLGTVKSRVRLALVRLRKTMEDSL